MTLATPIDHKITQTLKTYIPSVKVYLVGGAVRDFFSGKKSKDRDYLIENATLEQIATALKTIGIVNEIGKSFGIVQAVIDGESYDFALPRKEISTGDKHTDFEVDTNNVTLLEDLSRRDFTMNAIAYDIENGLTIDPYFGITNMKQKRIVFVGNVKDRFDEDPLRLIRMIQFAHRFKYGMDDDSIVFCSKNKEYVLERLHNISSERIWEELKKMFLKATIMSYEGDFIYDAFSIFFKPYFDIKEILEIKYISSYGKSEEEIISTYLISLFMLSGNYSLLKMPNYYIDMMNMVRDLLELKNSKYYFPKKFKNKNILKVICSALENICIDEQLYKLAKKVYNTPINISEFPMDGHELIAKGVNPKDIGDLINLISSEIYKGNISNDRNEIFRYINI